MSPISAIQPAKGEALIASTVANTAGKVIVTWETRPRPKPIDPVLRRAVLQYVKTVRLLGKTSGHLDFYEFSAPHLGATGLKVAGDH